MQKKAQAAMEFLMTYGWAILVVLVVLGALTYFGVLSPQTLLPSRCETGEMWLKCKDSKLDSTNNQFIITLENNWQYDVKVTSINVSSNVLSCSKTFTTTVIQGDEAKFTVDSCPDAIDAARAGKGKVKNDLSISWERADVTSPTSHTMTGVLIAQIEK